MPRKPLLFVTTFAFLFVILTGLIGFYAHKVSEGPLLTPHQTIHFELPWENQTFKFPEQANKLNLFYFGYTNCPDVCPLTLTYIAQSLKNIDSQLQDQIQVIFVSVDHQHDNPEATQVYAQSFDPHIKGMTGTESQINALVQQFHASYTIEKAEKTYLGYSVTHSDRVFFTNQNGEVIKSISNVQSVQEIQNHIKESL